MRINFSQIVEKKEENRYGQHWMTIIGANLIRDAAILIERKFKAGVMKMAANNQHRIGFDIVVMQTSDYLELVAFLKKEIPPENMEAHGELLIKLHAIAGEETTEL